METGAIHILTNYYQHFDADFTADVPGEGYGGWFKTSLPINPATTAVVVMHAWDAGTREQYPGWHKAVEYLPRSYEICRNVFPELLSSVRSSDLKLIHVVSNDDYYSSYSGYQNTLALVGPEPQPSEKVAKDPILEQLQAFRSKYVYPGVHNIPDINEGFKHVKFPKEANPHGDEAIAATEQQLFAICKKGGINHLIYTGFAINWCLLLSPGGMADMSKRGIMCSAIRQAVTAVENKETARTQLNKEIALWRVGLAFGFVYDVDDFVAAINN
jgi:hypothetical protein